MTDEPQLRCKDAKVVYCGDLDGFVNMHLEGYGITWRSLDTGYDGYHNGSYTTADVKLGRDIEDDDDQSFDRWLRGDGPFYLDPEGAYSRDLPDVQHILQWLCNIAAIPEGKYVVELWW